MGAQQHGAADRADPGAALPVGRVLAPLHGAPLPPRRVRRRGAHARRVAALRPEEVDQPAHAVLPRAHPPADHPGTQPPLVRLQHDALPRGWAHRTALALLQRQRFRHGRGGGGRRLARGLVLGDRLVSGLRQLEPRPGRRRDRDRAGADHQAAGEGPVRRGGGRGGGQQQPAAHADAADRAGDAAGHAAAGRAAPPGDAGPDAAPAEEAAQRLQDAAATAAAAADALHVGRGLAAAAAAS